MYRQFRRRQSDGAAVAYLINRFGIAIVLIVMTRRHLTSLSRSQAA